MNKTILILSLLSTNAIAAQYECSGVLEKEQYRSSSQVRGKVIFNEPEGTFSYRLNKVFLPDAKKDGEEEFVSPLSMVYRKEYSTKTGELVALISNSKDAQFDHEYRIYGVQTNSMRIIHKYEWLDCGDRMGCQNVEIRYDFGLACEKI